MGDRAAQARTIWLFRRRFDHPVRQGNGLNVRGHTLAWYAALPPWTAAIGSQAEAELVGHIRQTVTRYAGVIPTWDVVNEPIPDRPTSVRDLRESLWTKQIGPDYILLAFKTAHACDRSARLFINDYDIEYEDARSQAKRDAFLALLRKLKDDNVPVYGVGCRRAWSAVGPSTERGWVIFCAQSMVSGSIS
jgi:endo-1,4-beta-xylanase